ncbi:MAG: hypothetical protein V4537_05960 [Pseudomonadota bacterium]
MKHSSIERRARHAAVAMLALGLSIAAGAGIARWVVAGTTDYYRSPTDALGRPAYVRNQPVADTLWQRQGLGDAVSPHDQAAVNSTATSAQPAYRSASGS